MTLIDAILILVLLLGLFKGLKNGGIKQAVSLVGLVLSFVLAFSYKNLLASYMYERLPFFAFDGVFKGITSLNIIIYEMIAFFLVFAALLIVLKVVGAITGLIEKLLSATVILGIPSKIIGAILGVFESYILIFIVAYFLAQPFVNIDILDNSRISTFVLNQTPYVSNVADDYVDAFEEIYSIKNTFRDEEDKDVLNSQVIDILLKYKITTIDSIDILIQKDKIKENGLTETLEKYRMEE